MDAETERKAMKGRKAMRERSQPVSTERVTHEAASEALDRLVAAVFGDTSEVRLSIPARPDYDDDLVLSRYLEQARRWEDDAASWKASMF